VEDQGVKIRDLLDGLPIKRGEKIIDGGHPTGGAAQTHGGALKPDMLPLADQENGRNAHCKRNVLVAVTGCDLDREIMTLAGKVAREKKAQIFAVYGIEVPRTKAIDDEMPAETEAAHEALNQVASVADQMDIKIEPEIVQSRHFGHSLVDEAEAHDCALLIIGLPYRFAVADQIEGAETLDYVLRNAPCKVWIVRGQPPEKAERPERERERTTIVAR
jgi:nucleotide-binding universal stress UspA family protein